MPKGHHFGATYFFECGWVEGLSGATSSRGNAKSSVDVEGLLRYKILVRVSPVFSFALDLKCFICFSLTRIALYLLTIMSQPPFHTNTKHLFLSSLFCYNNWGFSRPFCLAELLYICTCVVYSVTRSTEKGKCQFRSEFILHLYVLDYSSNWMPTILKWINVLDIRKWMVLCDMQVFGVTVI